MTARLHLDERTLGVLRWSLILTCGLPALALVSRAALHGGHHGLVLAAIGALEAAGAALFVVRSLRRLGGWLLLSSLFAGGVFHLLAGEGPPWSFLVYAASIVVIMSAEAHREAR